MSQSKEKWASRVGLVLAMAGNAVGLGNFLRFPAQAAKNGGGAFLIPYLVALVVMGLPLIWVEWAMGRYGGQKGHHSAPGCFQSHGRSGFWKYFGIFGLWTNAVIAAYYLYIESWTMTYAGYSLIGGFKETKPDEFFAWMTGEVPNQILAFSGFGMLIFAVCIAINIFILSRGLAKGIELVSKIGMPLLLVFAALLAVRGFFITPGSGGDEHAVVSPMVGFNFVWEPRFEKLSDPSVWLAAAGQIFFTLSIGMGTIHCYASYLREKDDITLNGATAAWTNELCEIVLGGSILIPIAVAYMGLDKVQEMTAGGSGFGLGFMVFPTLFNNWGAFAPVAGFMWFGLLFFAAITSSLAMGQPVMAFLQSEYGISRERSAVLFGLMLLPLALPVALLHSASFFDEFDFWAGTFALVVFAMGEAILFAWVFGMKRGWEEINKGAELKVPGIFYYIIKYVTPAFLLAILLAATFKPLGRVEKVDPKTGVVVVDEKTKQPLTEDKGWEPHIKAAFGSGKAPEWQWAGDSLIGRLLHKDIPIPTGPDADPKKVEFTKNLQLTRDICRLVMLAVFVAFGWVIKNAWDTRKREGRA